MRISAPDRSRRPFAEVVLACAFLCACSSVPDVETAPEPEPAAAMPGPSPPADVPPPGAPPADAPSTDAALVRAVPGPVGASTRRNLHDGRGSNYARRFEAYDDVATATLVFPDDSLRLGTEQKGTIADYAERFRPGTDVVSVIGCSHGDSDLPNGNALLANGRANRVREALVYAGVPAEQVLDEGCWADSYHDPFPRRGVVLTLKRRADGSTTAR